MDSTLKATALVGSTPVGMVDRNPFLYYPFIAAAPFLPLPIANSQEATITVSTNSMCSPSSLLSPTALNTPSQHSQVSVYGKQGFSSRIVTRSSILYITSLLWRLHWPDRPEFSDGSSFYRVTCLEFLKVKAPERHSGLNFNWSLVSLLCFEVDNNLARVYFSLTIIFAYQIKKTNVLFDILVYFK